MIFEVLLLAGLLVWSAGFIKDNHVLWISLYWLVLLILALLGIV